MRRLFWTLVNAIGLCILLLISCSKDSESPSHTFKDQDAAGEIEGVEWAYADGYAATTGEGTSKKLHITLVLPHEAQGCDILPEGDFVLFSIPAIKGLYTLKLDFNNPENSYTVTLFDSDESMNVIAGKGAVEILSITESEVTGRIDARADDENYVNGNFSIPLCD
ncbi:MAG TPA: hypothetical protein VIL31_15190 [Cyclobacteriaceae bacterium]|jgi:hypothetical protein